jgi:hypothetical protein
MTARIPIRRCTPRTGSGEGLLTLTVYPPRDDDNTFHPRNTVLCETFGDKQCALALPEVSMLRRLTSPDCIHGDVEISLPLGGWKFDIDSEDVQITMPFVGFAPPGGKAPKKRILRVDRRDLHGALNACIAVGGET